MRASESWLFELDGEGGGALAALRAKVAGMRALFVSNRASPEVAAALGERLGLECSAEVLDTSPRRRTALVERIGNGAYDVVLIAHGFLSHGDTEALMAAARRAGCLYRMVDKGRPRKIVESLAAALLGPDRVREAPAQGGR